MIRVLAVGKFKDRRLAELAAQYEQRIRPLAPLDVIELRDQTPAREARQFLEKLGPTSRREHVVALDERGASMTSHEFAALLGRHGSLAFAVGGADGLDESIRDRADQMWRLSRLTFTHELARMLLLEQIYRGLAIQRGLPYHRD